MAILIILDFIQIPKDRFEAVEELSVLCVCSFFVPWLCVPWPRVSGEKAGLCFHYHYA